MSERSPEFAPQFKRAFDKKPAELQAAVLECVKRVCEDPTYPGLHVHKMRGVGEIWEAYVDKGNRITFEFAPGVVRFRMNCNHKILRRP